MLDLPDGEATDGIWLSAGTAREASLMQVPDLGCFVRAQLPIKLTGGYSLTYGVWVCVHPDDLQHAFKIWWSPEYDDLRLAGYLANRIEPWDVLGKPIEIAVRNSDQNPWCESSTDPVLASILSEEWDHTTVLPAR